MTSILDGPIPTTPEALTPDWITAALREAGVIEADAAVAEFDCTILGDGKGFTGRVGRLTLRYDGATDAPPTVIVKFPAADPVQRAEMIFYNIYPQEYGFYRDLAARQPFNVPRFYNGRVNAESGDSCLLLQDLADATPFNIFEGVSVEDARVVLERLAAFHARFWESPELDAYDWLRAFDAEAEGRKLRFDAAAESVIPRLGDRLPVGLVRAIETLRDDVGDIRPLLARHPRTLIHGDFHPNNLFWRVGPKGRDLVVLDWQIVAVARPERDLMYFLSTALLPEVRRVHRDDLVDFYVNQIAKHGVETYTLETCMRGYRLALLDLVKFVTIILNILDFTVNEEAEMMLELVLERMGGAVLDFELDDLLSAIPEESATSSS